MLREVMLCLSLAASCATACSSDGDAVATSPGSPSDQDSTSSASQDTDQPTSLLDGPISFDAYGLEVLVQDITATPVSTGEVLLETDATVRDTGGTPLDLALELYCDGQTGTLQHERDGDPETVAPALFGVDEEFCTALEPALIFDPPPNRSPGADGRTFGISDQPGVALDVSFGDLAAVASRSSVEVDPVCDALAAEYASGPDSELRLISSPDLCSLYDEDGLVLNLIVGSGAQAADLFLSLFDEDFDSAAAATGAQVLRSDWYVRRDLADDRWVVAYNFLDTEPGQSGLLDEVSHHAADAMS